MERTLGYVREKLTHEATMVTGEWYCSGTVVVL